MSERVRAFVAVELPGPVRRALAGLVQGLRGARMAGLKPVDPNGIHLTLKFLGDVPTAKIDSVVAAVASAVKDERRLTVRLGGVGVFPSRDRPRVLWMGVEDQGRSLLDMHRRLDEALERLAFPRDRREFSPHLTVARLRDGTSPAERRRAAEALFAAKGIESGLPIEVKSLSLMRSILSSDGARYERLARIPLGAGPPDESEETQIPHLDKRKTSLEPDAMRGKMFCLYGQTITNEVHPL